jgi:hypothetical protein
VHLLHQRRHRGPEHQQERRHALHHQLYTQPCMHQTQSKDEK